MITITKKEKSVFNQLKYLQMDYTGGLSENILKMDLDLSEHEIKEVLDNLEKKGLVSRGDEGKIKANYLDDEIEVVDTQKDVKTAELNQLELEALEIIRKIANPQGIISRYILEGNLLYGPLKVSNFRMYHIIISLENKKILRKLKKDDGEYYQVQY
ncbi:MAG: hypothetical protein KKF16_05920 [Euryarchaeota archaeon]|nr:hypothetical protein [Euryarchaeota archaeon]MBV1729120.1 hypothetical protein [Methanobacterium sp.]MBU4547908.1 hypothetical protein [Euryarchaeota archaeon]MBU4608472.1 hypothetical protein [Euryarchaeota archaeon]MBV1755784.1 hypothetical protein [Methanobacterium sp.]